MRSQDWGEAERRELVRAYAACRTTTEKQALGDRYGISLIQLYNRYSRWV